MEWIREKWNLFRYELKNTWRGISRHFVLCLSSVTSITITLLLVGLMLLVGVHVSRFSSGIAGELAIHAVLQDEISDPAQIEQLTRRIENMENVDHVIFSSKEEELENMIASKGEAFAVYRGEQNPLANAYFIFVKDASQIEQTTQNLRSMNEVADAVYGGTSVDELVRILVMVRRFAFAGAAAMLLLSVYLIYNTIKTTIASRSKEIGIMKTVGAKPSFIRVPFELEGVLIGFAGALIPFGLIAWLYPELYARFSGRLFISEFTLLPVRECLWLSGILLFSLGILTGLAASTLAVRKSLRKIR